MNADFEKKKTYHTLQILVEFIPASSIVTLYPELPTKILTMLFDQSKSQVCQVTLIKMVKSHWKVFKSEPNSSKGSQILELWRKTWIDNLLDLQSKETSESFRVNAGFIQYIKFILKTEPKSLTYILKRKDLKLVVRLMIIKSAADENLFVCGNKSEEVKSGRPDGLGQSEDVKLNGDCLDELNSRELWRGMVPMVTMYDAVWSFSNQVSSIFCLFRSRIFLDMLLAKSVTMKTCCVKSKQSI